ncbi:hypothetical protein SAMN05216598_4059 [Pseudomonas asplenii]|uniref:Uncharacterized protein n=1 Tax=Pseudomonas asplenii TaxID=53407 RepID=A0A1H1XTC7_9PSED|nr:hypothetical protein SAMN05216598_4059 [Pseudomonas asplenii]
MISAGIARKLERVSSWLAIGTLLFTLFVPGISIASGPDDAVVLPDLPSEPEFAPADNDFISAPDPRIRPVLGNRKVLLVVGHWADSTSRLDADSIYAMTLGDGRSLRTFVRRASQDKLNLSGVMIKDVDFGERTCNANEILSAARRGAQQQGFDPGAYDFIFVALSVGCGWGGLAVVPGNWIIGQTMSLDMWAHEFAHNLGAAHGASLTHCPVDGSQVLFPEDCTRIAYADTGDSVSGGGSRLFSASLRRHAGWLETEGAQTLLVRATRLYFLGRLGSVGRQLILIPRGVAPNRLALELRSSSPPFDIWPAGDNRLTGVWARLFDEATNTISQVQIDATPETATTADPTLQVGRVLVDRQQGLAVKVCWVGPTGAQLAIALAGQPLPACRAQVDVSQTAVPVAGEDGLIQIPVEVRADGQAVPASAGESMTYNAPSHTRIVDIACGSSNTKWIDPQGSFASCTIHAPGNWSISRPVILRTDPRVPTTLVADGRAALYMASGEIWGRTDLGVKLVGRVTVTQPFLPRARENERLEVPVAFAEHGAALPALAEQRVEYIAPSYARIIDIPCGSHNTKRIDPYGKSASCTTHADGSWGTSRPVMLQVASLAPSGKVSDGSVVFYSAAGTPWAHTDLGLELNGRSATLTQPTVPSGVAGATVTVVTVMRLEGAAVPAAAGESMAYVAPAHTRIIDLQCGSQNLKQIEPDAKHASCTTYAPGAWGTSRSVTLKIDDDAPVGDLLDGEAVLRATGGAIWGRSGLEVRVRVSPLP